ncbi:META domain-containing protein [Bizionia sediminis]|uniref:META domain-containing protein n=1 Tax=Bizionia sediminis TaxID=1737064 RepID=A0ABW5KRL3_9FLAO
MKYLSLLIINLFFLACGTNKQTAAMSQKDSLTGTYTISNQNNNKLLNQPLSLTFNSATRTVSGFSGCNRFTGSYTLHNESLTFGALATTRKLCQPELNNIEQQVLKHLEETASFIVNLDTVTLYNKQGEKLVTLHKNTEQTMKKNHTIKATYTAISRGYFLTVSYQNKTITYQTDRNKPAVTKELTETAYTTLNNLLEQINVPELPTLNAPSTAHQYDGAPGATLTINQNNQQYSTVTFDHNKPPHAIKALVSALIAYTEN